MPKALSCLQEMKKCCWWRLECAVSHLTWCEKHLTELREYLPLKNGIASPSTACRILSGIDEELFALEFMEWAGEIARTEGTHLAIDGKALRGAMEKVKNFRAPMVLNAIDAVTCLVVAQLPIQNKDCEITAIPELLKLLDIQRSTVRRMQWGRRLRSWSRFFPRKVILC